MKWINEPNVNQITNLKSANFLSCAKHNFGMKQKEIGAMHHELQESLTNFKLQLKEDESTFLSFTQSSLAFSILILFNLVLANLPR